MNVEEYPLKNLNLFAIPIAIVLAIYADSFWRYLLIAMGIGLAPANIMATLYIAKFKEALKQIDPVTEVIYKVQGVYNPSFHIRFIFMQSITGALVTGVWYAIASGVVVLFR